MKVVLAKGQERGGVEPALFRLHQTVMNRRQAVKRLLIQRAQADRLHS